jgi:hypothetical protein
MSALPSPTAILGGFPGLPPGMAMNVISPYGAAATAVSSAGGAWYSAAKMGDEAAGAGAGSAAAAGGAGAAPAAGSGGSASSDDPAVPRSSSGADALL